MKDRVLLTRDLPRAQLGDNKRTKTIQNHIADAPCMPYMLKAYIGVVLGVNGAAYMAVPWVVVSGYGIVLDPTSYRNGTCDVTV